MGSFLMQNAEFIMQNAKCRMQNAKLFRYVFLRSHGNNLNAERGVRSAERLHSVTLHSQGKRFR